MFQDITVSLGPAIESNIFTATLHDARLVPRPGLVWIFASVAVPLAVYVWHKETAPALPPPARAARRVLTAAAAMLTLTLASGGTTTAVVLALRHHPGISWWSVPAPVIYAVVPLQAADRARRRFRPGPSPATEPR